MRTDNLTKQQSGKLKRLERAKAILAHGDLFPISGATEKFVCFSQSKQGWKIYLIDLAEGYCTCPDFQENQKWNGGWCKHRIAAWLSVHHPDDYQDFLPDWAEDEQGHGDGKQDGAALDKSLAELPDAALARIIARASQEQMDRDYRRAVAEDG